MIKIIWYIKLMFNINKRNNYLSISMVLQTILLKIVAFD